MTTEAIRIQTKYWSYSAHLVKNRLDTRTNDDLVITLTTETFKDDRNRILKAKWPSTSHRAQRRSFHLVTLLYFSQWPTPHTHKKAFPLNCPSQNRGREQLFKWLLTSVNPHQTLVPFNISIFKWLLTSELLAIKSWTAFTNDTHLFKFVFLIPCFLDHTRILRFSQ